jgi:hypothetical protein
MPFEAHVNVLWEIKTKRSTMDIVDFLVKEKPPSSGGLPIWNVFRGFYSYTSDWYYGLHDSCTSKREYRDRKT